MKMKIYNMKVFLVVLAATLTLSLSAPAVQAATVTATASGDYQVGTNFDTGNSPGPTDDAVITGGFDFTSSANIFVGNGVGGATGTRAGGVGSITVDDGSLTVTELGLAFLRQGAPSTASLNIGSAGSVDLNQVWFGAATDEVATNQNDVSINFTGDGGSLSVLTGFSAVEGAGSFRLTTNNVTAFNVVGFEELFDLGFLTNDGLSGLDGAIFSENFAISEGGATITAITLTSVVPEPSSLAMLGLISLVVVGRRRR